MDLAPFLIASLGVGALTGGLLCFAGEMIARRVPQAWRGLTWVGVSAALAAVAIPYLSTSWKHLLP